MTPAGLPLLSRTLSLAVLWLGLAAMLASSQPPAPPPPAKYHAVLRYQLPPERNQHVAGYDALVEHLQRLGFEFIPPLETHPQTDREDPSKNQLEGLIPSKNALRILENTSVASLLLSPPDFKKPAEADSAVRIRLELAGRLPPARQRELAEQTLVLLREFGFKEAIAYDHRGHSRRPFTRLLGTLPAGQLDTLLKDLRSQPTGWFAPRIALEDLPTPLRNFSPVLVTEVLPDPDPAKPPVEPEARGQDFLEKISPDLWALVMQKDQEERFVPLEVILVTTPEPGDRGWRVSLRREAPSFLVEGQLGQFIAGYGRIGDVPSLAALPNVAVVRLPRTPLVEAKPVSPQQTDNARALRESGLEALHKRGHRGQGTRLAIIDTDFRGWEEGVKDKHLPPKTSLVDLTAEGNLDALPDPYPDKGGGPGHGTQLARATALAAPEADLVLIRIKGTTPVQLYQAHRYFQGSILSENLDRISDEIDLLRARLRVRREELFREEAALKEVFEDELPTQEEFAYLGVVRAWLFSRREYHQLRVKEVERDQAGVQAVEDRFLKLVDDIRGLKGISVATTALVWNDGYPLGGASPLTRYFDDQPRHRPLWFQSAGNTRGQTWNGLIRDTDGNGVVEFALPEVKLPAGRFNHELNFLAWQPYLAAGSANLPSGVKLRLSIQWREPHDPDYFARPGEEDLYRKPLADLRLLLLRQRDPGGKTYAADDFEIVARFAGLPQRLENQPSFSVYEQAVEVTLEKAGRYAVRIEQQVSSKWILATEPGKDRLSFRQEAGLAATGIRPRGAPTLEGLEKSWELRTRLFVAAVDPASSKTGRPVFLDYATDLGTLGLPADAREVITVGAASLDNQVRHYSAAGPPMDREMFFKPDVYSYDALEVGRAATGAFGTSISAAFSAGLAASVLSSGTTPAEFLRSLQTQKGKVLKVP